jgi:kinesin family protein 15
MLQEELFRVAGLPMVDNCMAGYNSCMFAYGQVSSSQIFDVSITVICKK